MALSITNNIASLTAQHNLNRTSTALGKSLERLSSGLKINRGADGPAALVISEQQRAQIAGLQTAIDNTSKAVSVVQTAEGALNEINSLLVKARGLALDSANSGVQDADSLAANQAEIDNILDTIDRIANNTQFGTKKLLDGSAGVQGSVSSGAKISFQSAPSTAVAGNYAVNVSTAASKAIVASGNSNTATTTTLAADETLTVNGTSISLAAGLTKAGVVSKINEFSSQTGVTADLLVTQANSSNYTTTGGTVAATSTTDLATIDQFLGIANGETITATGTDDTGTTFSTTFTYDNTGTASTLGDLASAINSAIAAGGGTVSVSGAQLQIANAGGQTASVSLSLAKGTGAYTFTANTVADVNDTLRLVSDNFGSNGTIQVVSNVAAGATSTGFGTTVQNVAGTDVVGTINGVSATGRGNVLSGATGTANAGISVVVSNVTTGNATSTATGSVGTLTLANNSLVFQIGANASQTATLGIGSAKTTTLGVNLAGNQFANLSEIDIQTSSGAADSLAVIDAAVANISTFRGTLGAFQQQTLESTANNLRATLENTVSAESVIRDTDFAAETAAFTKNQVLIQAGTTVLSNANATAQLVLSLLGR